MLSQMTFVHSKAQYFPQIFLQIDVPNNELRFQNNNGTLTHTIYSKIFDSRFPKRNSK